MRRDSVIIVGGGAAGLIAAITAARSGLMVTLLEQNSKVGKKIFVSGNGKCNIGNRIILSARYHSQNADFVSDVFVGYGTEEIERVFEGMGLPLIEGAEGKLFPLSRQASAVVDILLYEAQSTGVEIVCNCEVQAIQRDEKNFLLQTTLGEMRSSRLLLASGSPAAPRLGGSFRGLEMAASLGHTIIDPHPSLVQLRSEERWVKRASGAKVDAAVTLFVDGDRIVEKRGDILLTDYGISGLAILDISYEVSRNLAAFSYCELSIDLFPDKSKEGLTTFLFGRINQQSEKPLGLWLQGVLHKKLIPVVLEQSGCGAKVERNLNRKEVGRLVYAVKNIKLPLSGTRGFEGAEVAMGGVDTREVDPRTMQSKRIRHLYFAGEILDVDGDRGGFNFHFAWTSGIRAAKAIVASIE